MRGWGLHAPKTPSWGSVAGKTRQGSNNRGAAYRSFRDSVKTRRVLRKISLPARLIPKFQMIANTKENHFVSKVGKLPKTVRDQNAPGPIEIDLFCLSKIEASKDPRLCIGRWSGVQPCRKGFQSVFGENPKAFIWPRGNKKEFRLTQLIPNALGKRQTLLVVQSSLVCSG